MSNPTHVQPLVVCGAVQSSGLWDAAVWMRWLIGIKNTLLEILYLLNVILIKQTDMKQYNNIDLSEIHSCGVDGFTQNYIKCKNKTTEQKGL